MKPVNSTSPTTTLPTVENASLRLKTKGHEARRKILEGRSLPDLSRDPPVGSGQSSHVQGISRPSLHHASFGLNRLGPSRPRVPAERDAAHDM